MSPRPVARLLDLGDRAAIVTGAGTGIGRAIAARLAEAGARVVVHYRTSGEGACQTTQAIGAAGGHAVALAADLTIGDEVSAFLAAAEEAVGRPDILVNNAGTYPVVPLAQMTDLEWREVLHANLTTVHHCTRGVGARMDPGGAIVNVASIEALQPMPGHAHYVAAKAGVLAYTRAAALELGGKGIRVNAVSPGLVDRGGLEMEWPEGVERWRAVAPLGLGEPTDVADACLFLVSDAARWITGAHLVVDGGGLTRPAF